MISGADVSIHLFWKPALEEEQDQIKIVDKAGFNPSILETSVGRYEDVNNGAIQYGFQSIYSGNQRWKKAGIAEYVAKIKFQSIYSGNQRWKLMISKPVYSNVLVSIHLFWKPALEEALLVAIRPKLTCFNPSILETSVGRCGHSGAS